MTISSAAPGGRITAASFAQPDVSDITNLFLFKTISVSGQSDVVADSSADTLTLAAGSGITITTNAGTDTITIAATGGGLPPDLLSMIAAYG